MTSPAATGRLMATADLAPAPSWRLTGRGLEADVDPLWVGCRPYQDENDPSRMVVEFRDPRQLTPEYLALWGRLACAPGHPTTADGKLVFLDATAPAEGAPHPADPDNAVVFPHAAFQVGVVGDAYRMVPGEHGTQVPRFRTTITDKATIERSLNPAGGYRRDQVSPGFMRFVVDGPGVWTAPDGTTHPYDREQVVNPNDPRVPEHLRPWVGPNYLGVGFDPRTSWTRGKGAARLSLDGALAASGDQPPAAETPMTTPTQPQQPAPAATPDAPPQPPVQQPAPDAAAVAAMRAENATLKARVAELEQQLAAAQAAKAAADGVTAARDALRAERDALLAEVKPHREAARAAEVERVAAVAEVDGDVLARAEDEVTVDGKPAKVPARDLRVAAMKIRLTADGAFDPARHSEDYLRARFDILAESRVGSVPPAHRSTAGSRADETRAAADGGPTPGFRRAVSGVEPSRAPRDASFDELP